LVYAVMLNVVTLNVVMLNVVMLNVVMLSAANKPFGLCCNAECRYAEHLK
jgi:hypothetical protein